PWERSHSLRRRESTACSITLRHVETIETHDLVPRRHEVADEFLLCVIARVDLREGTKFGVRAEEEVDAAGGPLDLAGPSRASREGLRGSGRRRPLRVHVEEVHEEVAGQRSGLPCEHADIRLPDVSVERT